jgi:hypothetical protein
MRSISKYSVGIGDRFGLEGQAQLRAFVAARARGLDITPVWNKSNREHSLIGTRPEDVRAEADAATRACAWSSPYLVDADHIGLLTVDKFVGACDFFTIDVADSIGTPASEASRSAYVEDMRRYLGPHSVPGLEQPIVIAAEDLHAFAEQYLGAVEEAGRVYRHIAGKRGTDFVTEVSFDEATTAQTPAELFLILAALGREKVPVGTIAPKFTGDFFKGIDYVGDLGRFTQEFAADVAVVAFAKRAFWLPDGLKLSVHSGSDKFSLYPIMHAALQRIGAGLHLKTAGTTWLEEVAGLAQAGGAGLDFAKALYREAVARYDELAKPYATVIGIDRRALPTPDQVDGWTSQQYVETLEHDQRCPRFSVHFRQLVHISFRIAAEKGARFIELLQANRACIETRVCDNLLRRHIEPLFFGSYRTE